MSIVRINALNVPPQAGDEIAKRFAARADGLADVAGFEGFELLRPTGEAETRWFVYTRWSDEEAYAAWRDGEGARNAHAGPSEGEKADAEKGDGGEDKPSEGGPVSMGATLLEFDVAVEAAASGV